MDTKKKNLKSRYKYQTAYFNNVEKLRESILNKTIIPHQVEVQPGPEGGKICWLECPYCYGGSSIDTGERLSLDRYLEIMDQIAEGGVSKIIFAGYATDPLNYVHIEELHNKTILYNQIFGFHTKAIKVSNILINQLTDPRIEPLSYFSVSVDAGTNESYNKVHGVSNLKAKIYDRVIDNIKNITKARSKTKVPLDLSITYLVNNINNSSDEVLKHINDFRDAGVDLIRFTFPQVPRGYEYGEGDLFIPKRDEVLEFMHRLTPLVKKEDSDACKVIIMDLDKDYKIDQMKRTLPCYARFVFPSIGFDGWLAHCSESAAPHFRDNALGNLSNTDFWDIFYDYDVNNFKKYMVGACKKMVKTNCKCDRKEHVVNAGIINSGVFNPELK